MARKGGDFERELCYILSRWWSGGRRDDIFWRSNASGARATTRAKRGLNTAGQYGDIAATDPCGAPLLDIAVIESKRGYSRSTLGDLLDYPTTVAVQDWERWVATAERDAASAGSFAWLIVARRDRRRPLAAMPARLWEALVDEGCFTVPAPPQARLWVEARNGHGAEPHELYVTSLERFLAETNAAVFRRLTRRC